DQQPLSVIADDGFIELMKKAIPNCKLPSKKAIKILLSQAFTYTKQQFMDKLSETLFYTRHLKKINLTTAKWDTIKDLLPILKPFTEATKFLEGSNYSMISFMFYIISILASDLASNDDDNSVMIDFESNATAFDDDIIYEDADEKIDEITNRTRQI
ncbi:29540_t:CDS:2, partial [Racocetra persica]